MAVIDRLATCDPGIPFSSPDEIELVAGHSEGSIRQSLVNIRKRSESNRRACVEHHGTLCHICGFCFGEAYGKVAEGFIHVHHLRPLSEGERVETPAEALVPVCANCHAVLHLRTPPYETCEVKAFLEGRVVRPCLPEAGSSLDEK